MDEINLVGKRVTAIRLLTDKELEAEGWEEGSPVTAIEFDDGSLVYASMDEEGNGPGELFGVYKGKTIIISG
jgi:hypothetical protein